MERNAKPYASQLSELTTYLDPRPALPHPQDWLRKGHGATASKPVPITKKYRPFKTGLEQIRRFEEQESHDSPLPQVKPDKDTPTCVAECLAIHRQEKITRSSKTENCAEGKSTVLLLPGYRVEMDSTGKAKPCKRLVTTCPGNPTNESTHARLFEPSPDPPKVPRRHSRDQFRTVNIVTGALME